MQSIIQTEKKCFMCHSTVGLHKHHVFGAANRNLSEKYGLWIWLCPKDHNISDEPPYKGMPDRRVHFNKELNLEIKKLAQREFEDTHSREDFLRIFGKNYL